MFDNSVRNKKKYFAVLHTDDSDIQRQSFVAGYRKCMDEIHNFCKENNIPAEVKTSLQQQIDTKMRHLKGEEAVDLSVSADKKEAKLSEQLQAIADSAPPIQPKNTHQIGTINQSPLTQNTNVQIIQRPNNASNGQVTVLCQKEPSTYVLVPTAAICQQVQIQSASQGYPIIVQNSAPSYEIKQSVSERNGQACHLPNSGQIIMVPNSSLSTPVLNTNANLATTPKPVITGNAFAPAAPYYQPMTTSFAVKNCPVSSSKIQVANQVIRLPMASSISTEAHQASSFQNDANDPDTMWRPW